MLKSATRGGGPGPLEFYHLPHPPCRTGAAFSVRPSFALPFMVGTSDEVADALFLRSFGVPFWAVVAGRPAAAVAAELGLSVGAVYAAKFRILTRLREELADLLD